MLPVTCLPTEATPTEMYKHAARVHKLVRKGTTCPRGSNSQLSIRYEIPSLDMTPFTPSSRAKASRRLYTRKRCDAILRC
jgi:hypothetical protein